MWKLRDVRRRTVLSRVMTAAPFGLWLGMVNAAAGGAGETVADHTAREPVITVEGTSFTSWHEYAASDVFRRKGLRCGTVPSRIDVLNRDGTPADCTFSLTNPDPVYAPSVAKYRIPVVVHVIRNSTGTQGDISEAMVHSQIEILNEDFLALAGTNGANGIDVQIEFYLATLDPLGNPTNGITYSDNSTWFNDGGYYWNTLAWDTNRYLNIYTNLASGALGYVPDLPQGGIVGSNADRVVILWSTFGRNGPFGPPYDQGRTVTHEVGHYLGLDHPWAYGGCPPASNCYTNGDLICDTNPQSQPTGGCYNANSCSSPDAIHNYMDYSDDLCMEEFTPDQTLRMRCSLEHYRPALYEMVSNVETPPDVVPVPGPEAGRYVRFEAPGGTGEEAIRVTIVDLDGFALPSPNTLFVGPSFDAPDEDASLPGRTFVAAPLQCEVHFQTWSPLGPVSVYGAEIVPASRYRVQRAYSSCLATGGESCYSAAVTITTGKFGDVASVFHGGPTPQPDFNDIAAVVQKFQAGPGAPSKALAQLIPNVVFPDRTIDFKDIAADVSAFAGTAYADLDAVSGPCVCPSSVNCGVTACVNDLQCAGGYCVAGFCTDACGRCAP